MIGPVASSAEQEASSNRRSPESLFESQNHKKKKLPNLIIAAIAVATLAILGMTQSVNNIHRSFNISSVSSEALWESVDPKPPCPTHPVWSRNDTIKFYLYPPEIFPSFWGGNSSCDHSKSKTPKHDHEEFAWNAMKRHPWRTSNPREAKIAFLPLSLNLWKRNGCNNGQVNKFTVRAEVEKALQGTGIFPHTRHVVLLHDFAVQGKDTNHILKALEPALIQVRMEGRGDCVISHGYTSNYAVQNSLRNPNNFNLPDNHRTGDQRIYSVHMVGQVDGRKNYGHRMALFTKLSSKIPNNPFMLAPYKNDPRVLRALRQCNVSSTTANALEFDLEFDHDRCMLPSGVEIGRDVSQQTQEKSNYTLCLRGDTLGSDRWINGMAAGTALIQVIAREEDWNWLPFPDAIPWRDFVITIRETDFLKNPGESVRQVLETTSEERLLELQRMSLYYSADLDWMAHNSRVLENLIRDAISVPCKAFDALQHDNKIG